ncbi:MAG: UDP-N-acetyl glucosamine 2-epimerase, partial [Deltaproteobacteria bacterium]|nr:UDP-N-acetyl glucosamine 2-epimerase [Deltaproteobacteria bacterium]
RDEFEESIRFKLGQKNLMITFHPVTLECATAREQFQNLLDALDILEDTKFIFTKPNADTDGRIIIQMIDDYVSRNSNKSIAFVNLGQLRYLSAMRFVDGVIGNSSSGLAEAPTFKIGTINLGDRQKGRIKADSVIDCEPIKEAILTAIKKIYSIEFNNKLKNVKNPYGEGGAAERIKEIIKESDLTAILKKEFYDLGLGV